MFVEDHADELEIFDIIIVLDKFNKPKNPDRQYKYVKSCALEFGGDFSPTPQLRSPSMLKAEDRVHDDLNRIIKTYEASI